MRVLTSTEINVVAGGLSVPEDVLNSMTDAYIRAKNQGMSDSEAMQACWGLGGAASVGGVRNPYSRVDVEQICKDAVNEYNKLVNKTPGAICEQVDGGTWNSKTKECVF